LDALNLLKPLTDFHRAVEGATQNDLRLFWDVRIVRGENTPYCHVHGSSSLPALLAENMRVESPERIEREATNKIVVPLVSFMQIEVTKMLFADEVLEPEPTDTYFNDEVNFDDGSDEPAPEQFDDSLH
jgi:hypothetical protein